MHFTGSETSLFLYNIIFYDKNINILFPLTEQHQEALQCSKQEQESLLESLQSAEQLNEECEVSMLFCTPIC